MRVEGEKDLIFTFPGARVPVPGASGDGAHVAAFDLRRGKVTLITGKSGSGKSWFFAALLGCADPSALHWWPGSTARRQLRAVPRIPEQIPCALVHQLPLVRAELGAEDEWLATLNELGVRHRISLFGALGLEGCQLRQVGHLSGGQLKRFGIALRLAAPADVIALDEPEAGLDEAMISQVLKAIVALPGPPAVIAVTHQPGVWERELPALGWSTERVVLRELAPRETQRGGVLRGMLQRVDRLVDNIRWPLMARIVHLLSMWVRTPLDWAMVLFAPVLIGLGIGLQGDVMLVEGSQSWETRQAFFAVIAACWLGLQFMSRECHAQILTQCEDLRWLNRLRPLPAHGLAAAVASTVAGALAATLIAAVQSLLLAAAVQFSASRVPGSTLVAGEASELARLWLGLGLSSLWGVLLGQTLALVLAACQMANPWRRALPSVLWVNLLVPLVMLTHIVFSDSYLWGRATDPGAPGTSWVHAVAGSLPTRFGTVMLTASHIKTAALDLDVWLWLGKCATATLCISALATLLIIRTPEIRRR